jgi:hypothetical protein
MHDAIGLVTLLGARVPNESIGHVQLRLCIEYLPLLAAYVTAGSRFTNVCSSRNLSSMILPLV